MCYNNFIKLSQLVNKICFFYITKTSILKQILVVFCRTTKYKNNSKFHYLTKANDKHKLFINSKKVYLAMETKESGSLLTVKNIKILLFIICIIYIISPYDFIYDFIPIGRIDDIFALFVAFFLGKSIFFPSQSELHAKYIPYFQKEYPEVFSNYNSLLKSLGNDEKFSFYKEEAGKVFDELMKVYVNTVESDKRIEKFDELRDKLRDTLYTSDKSTRAIEGVEKSKQLIERLDKEEKELRNYIEKAQEEIKATALDFIHVTAEIELSKASGELAEPSKLSSRSKSLSYIASNLPVTTGLTENSK